MRALSRLATDERMVDLIVEHGAVDLTLDAMRAHAAKDSELLQAAFYLLASALLAESGVAAMSRANGWVGGRAAARATATRYGFKRDGILSRLVSR